MVPHRLALVVLLFSLALSGGASAQVKVSKRVSVTPEGGESNDRSRLSSISADGTRVAFESWADNLVPDDTNGEPDIFLLDRRDGRIVRVSVSTSGQQANGESSCTSISGDGRFVAFCSIADNLVAGDTNAFADVFLHDSLTHQTSRISVRSDGQEGNANSNSNWPWSLSYDGRFVAFESLADNLVVGDTNGVRDVFVHDTQTAKTVRFSVDSGGQEGNAISGNPCLSPDGRYAAFDGNATNLVAGGTSGSRTVFLHDLQTGTTSLASYTGGGLECQLSHLSNEGRYVVYSAWHLGFDSDIYIFDTSTGQNHHVSLSNLGQSPNGSSFQGTISEDGRFLVFASYADNLVGGDGNGFVDVFLRDLVLGQTTKLSFGFPWGGMGQSVNNYCYSPCLSSDGSTVTYYSDASNIVPFDQNGTMDVFAVDLADCAPTVAPYCVASATSIPGCEASVSATGMPSLSNSAAFAISTAPLPGGANGISFWGTHGPRDQSFGTQGGHICVASPVARTLLHSSGGTSGVCNGRIDLTLQDLLSIDPFTVQAGQTIHTQTWFRDPMSADGFGLSSALWFHVCP